MDVAAAKTTVLNAFRKLDGKHEGTISRKAFLRLCEELGVSLTVAELNEIVSQVGAAHGDDLRFNEMVNWLFKPSSVPDTTMAILQYIQHDTLKEELAAENVVLLRGSWLANHSSKGAPLPRRQALPSHAIWSVEDLFPLVADMEERECAMKLPIACVSYCWLTPRHPDPKGQQLKKLAQITELYINHLKALFLAAGLESEADVGIFIDWCSLYQKPFHPDSDEKVIFQRGLSRVNLWYAHQSTSKWLITYFPGYPPVRSYHDRGWPTFERAISELISPCGMVLDLGILEPEIETYQHACETCEIGRRPPIIPRDFEIMLSKKVFTNKVDIDIVVKKHDQTFHAIVSATQRLDFSSLRWGDDEAFALAQALPFFSALELLNLKSNSIGDEGVALLLGVLPSCPLLQHLWLGRNQISQSVVELTKASWTKHNRILGNLQIGEQRTDLEIVSRDSDSDEAECANDWQVERPHIPDHAQVFVASPSLALVTRTSLCDVVDNSGLHDDSLCESPAHPCGEKVLFGSCDVGAECEQVVEAEVEVARAAAENVARISAETAEVARSKAAMMDEEASLAAALEKKRQAEEKLLRLRNQEQLLDQLVSTSGMIAEEENETKKIGCASGPGDELQASQLEPLPKAKSKAKSETLAKKRKEKQELSESTNDEGFPVTLGIGLGAYLQREISDEERHRRIESCWFNHDGVIRSLSSSSSVVAPQDTEGSRRSKASKNSSKLSVIESVSGHSKGMHGISKTSSSRTSSCLTLSKRPESSHGKPNTARRSEESPNRPKSSHRKSQAKNSLMQRRIGSNLMSFDTSLTGTLTGT